MRCRRSVRLAAGVGVGERSKLRVAAILVLQRRQGRVARGGRVLLRVGWRSREATERAQARLLRRRMLGLRLLLVLLGLELLLRLLARLGGRLLLAGLRLELRAIRHVARRELVIHAGWLRKGKVLGTMWSGVERRGTGDWCPMASHAAPPAVLSSGKSGGCKSVRTAAGRLTSINRSLGSCTS